MPLVAAVLQLLLLAITVSGCGDNEEEMRAKQVYKESQQVIIRAERAIGEGEYPLALSLLRRAQAMELTEEQDQRVKQLTEASIRRSFNILDTKGTPPPDPSG